MKYEQNNKMTLVQILTFVHNKNILRFYTILLLNSSGKNWLTFNTFRAKTQIYFHFLHSAEAELMCLSFIWTLIVYIQSPLFEHFFRLSCKQILCIEFAHLYWKNHCYIHLPLMTQTNYLARSGHNSQTFCLMMEWRNSAKVDRRSTHDYSYYRHHIQELYTWK